MKFLLVFLTNIFLCTGAFAQFTNESVLVNNSFQFAEINESENVALVGGYPVFKSVDAGFTWNYLNLGTAGVPFVSYQYVDAVIVDANIYVMIGMDVINHKSGIARTIDGGVTWNMVYETAVGGSDYFEVIEYDGSVMMIGGEEGVYRSADNGATWSIVQPSGFGSSVYNIVQYNTISGEWLAQRYVGNHYKSVDGGLNWTLNNFPAFDALGVRAMNNENGEILVTKYLSGNNELFDINSSMLVVDSVYPNSTLFSIIDEAVFLPNGDVISHNGMDFLYTDVATDLTYYYNHVHSDTNGLSTQIYDLELGSTYGLGVGNNGSISRLDLSQPVDLYLPADFYHSNTQCINDPLSAYPLYNYGDSLQWYLDGALISTDTLVNTFNPSVGGTYDLVLLNWYNGSYTTDTTSLYVEGIETAPIYNVSAPNPCFNSTTLITVDYVSGTTSGANLQILLNGQSLYNSAATTNIVYQWTPPINSLDTILVISTFPQSCGTTYDTTELIIYSGPDLTIQYNLIPSDYFLCSGEQSTIVLDGLDSNFDYNITYLGFDTTFAGTNGATVTINGSGMNNFQSSYMDENYPFYMIITDTTCSSGSMQLGTFTISRPGGFFYPHSQSYYQGDTVKISNVLVRDDRLWQVDPNILSISNINDTVPEIIATTTGEYEISLINDGLTACKDSAWREIRVCDTLFSQLDRCWEVSNGEQKTFLKEISIDQFGNIYEVATKRSHPQANNAGTRFSLTKRDPSGDILWIKEPPQFTATYMKSVIVSDIDFDENGDIYCGVWISGDGSYSFDSIVYQEYSYLMETMSYLVKLDGQTGDMLWYKEIGSYPLTANLPTSSDWTWRISDIVLTSDEVIFAISGGRYFYIVSTDLDGNYITDSNIGLSYGSVYFENSSHNDMSSNGGPMENYTNPQLKQLSTGEIALMAFYHGQPGYLGSTISELVSVNEMALMAAKYSSQDGLTQFKKVATIPYADWLNCNACGQVDTEVSFDVDSSDNITAAMAWLRTGYQWQSPFDSVYIMDSVVTKYWGSAIVQIDSNFNLNWTTTGNYSRFCDLEVDKSTGEITVLGKSSHNMAFGQGGNDFMFGGYGSFAEEYGTNINFWKVASYPIFHEDFYLAKFSSDGMPIDGRFLETTEQTLPYQAQSTSARMDLSYCGDPIISVHRFGTMTDSMYLIDGTDSLSLNSNLLAQYSLNCAGQQCTYASIGIDSIVSCSGSSGTTNIPFTALINVDSVTYIAVNGGVPGPILTGVTSNNGFLADLTSITVSGELIILTPVQDTIVVTTTPAGPVPAYASAGLTCYGGGLLINAVPSNYDYVWDGVPSSSSTHIFNSTVYGYGLHQFPTEATDLLGCVHFDTLEILVPDFPNPWYTYDSIMCSGNDQIIYALDSTLDYYWMGTGGNVDSFYVNSSNYSNGLLDVTVTLFDTNSCFFYDTLSINIISAAPNYTYSSTQCETDTQFIYSSNPYNSYDWLGTTITGYNLEINSGITSIGLNYIDVISTDTIGCVYYDTLLIEIIEIPQPTYTYYSDMCENDIQVIHVSNLSYEYHWLNNSVIADSLSLNGATLSIGVNEIDVVSMDQNGCENTDTLLIDVHVPIQPIFDSVYYLSCGDSLVIMFNDFNFNSQEWYVSSTPSQNNFSGNNLTNGVNNISVDLVDINGCAESYSMQIDYCFDLGFEGLMEEPISVYPNPSNGHFTIEIESKAEEISLEITDALGRVIEEIEILSGLNEIKLNHLEKGHYYLNFTFDSYMTTKKIVIH